MHAFYVKYPPSFLHPSTEIQFPGHPYPWQASCLRPNPNEFMTTPLLTNPATPVNP